MSSFKSPVGRIEVFCGLIVVPGLLFDTTDLMH